MKIAGKFPNIRLRRVRNSSWIRRLISENNLSVNDLILPIFVRDGKNKIEPIKSMPGVNRYSVDKLNIYTILFNIEIQVVGNDIYFLLQFLLPDWILAQGLSSDE